MRSANRAYEATVRVRGRPVKEVHHRGQTYIEGRKGTEYTLHFTNNSPDRVLLITSVDGLNVLSGNPAGRESRGLVVDPWKSVEIPGWKVDEAYSSSGGAKFVFWPQDARAEKTYVEELAREGAQVDPGNQGMIGFLVISEKKSAWPPRNINPLGPWVNPPPTIRPSPYIPKGPGPYWGVTDDSFTRSVMSTTTGTAPATLNMAQTSASASVQPGDTGLGTKFGGETQFRTHSVEFERDKVVGELVLVYDTLRGLKDQGVPTDLFTQKKSNYTTRSAFPADRQGGCKPPASAGWPERKA